MKLMGIIDFCVALTILWGGSYLPKKWQQGIAVFVCLALCFIGGATILNSFA